MKNHTYILLSILLFASCGHNINKNQELDHIEDIIQAYPDSALILLDSLNLSPGNLYDQNRYCLYRIQAKDLSNKNISEDKNILDVYTYFKDNEFNELTGRAAYCCGRVLQEDKKYDEAVPYYNIAISKAIENDDKDFQGIILYSMGWLMLDHYMIDEGKIKLAEANSLFLETGNQKYIIKSHKLSGNYFLLSDEIDSSLIYYNRGLDVAIRYNNKKEQSTIMQNIGVALNQKEDFRGAVATLLKAVQIDSAAHTSGKIFLNLAQSYMDLEMADSARYYADCGLSTAKKDSAANTKVIATAYEILSQIAKQSGNYKNALEQHKLYSKHLARILTQNKNAAIVEAEKKYKFEALQNENTLLAVKHLKTQRILYLALLFIAIITIIYYRKLLYKSNQLTKATEEILALTDTVKGFGLTFKEYDMTLKESYRDNLVHNFNILKRAASLEAFVQDLENKQGKALIKNFNVIAYGKETIDWEILYRIINSVNKGRFDTLRTKYKGLDEVDIQICCLIYSKFNSNEIAVITQLSINTVHWRTTLIRKKPGIEKYGNIIDFLNENLTG